MSRTRPFIGPRYVENNKPKKPLPIRPHLVDDEMEGEPTHYGSNIAERPVRRSRRHSSTALRKWLRAQINRPWNKVYSELCDRVDRVIISEDVLCWMVYTKVVIDNGKVFDKSGSRHSFCEINDALYVDPHGILKLSKPYRYKRPSPARYLLRDGSKVLFIASNGHVYEFEESVSVPHRKTYVEQGVPTPVYPPVPVIDVTCKPEMGFGYLILPCGWAWREGKARTRLQKLHDEREIRPQHIKASSSKTIERLRTKLNKLTPVPYSKSKEEDLIRQNKFHGKATA